MEHRSRLGRVSSAVVAAALLATVVGITPVAALTSSSTTMVSPDLNPKPVGMTTLLVATVTEGATGTVQFYEDDLGTRTLIDTGTVNAGTYLGQNGAFVTVPSDYPTGTYHVVAVYSGDGTFAGSESAAVTFIVGPRPVSVAITVVGPHDGTGATAQKGDSITIIAHVTDAGSVSQLAPVVLGSLSFKVDGNEIGTSAIADDQVDAATGSWSLGAHTITVDFTSSDVNHADGTEQVPITLVANVVEATASVQYTTFYPVKDGYRDTVKLRGSRNESASVTIRVYNSTGTRVKSVSIASGTGAWSYAWSGRRSDGTILASGKYKVVQVATDALGAKKTFTNYVSLSKKKLYTYTVTLKKDLTQLAKKTSTWVGWTFTLPSATVYKGLSFGIYGRDTFGTGGFGPHDYSECATTTWNISCVTRWKSFPTTYTWKSVTGSVTKDRSGRSVKLYAWGGNGDTRIKYGRVKVTYAILK